MPARLGRLGPLDRGGQAESLAPPARLARLEQMRDRPGSPGAPQLTAIR